MLFQNGITLTKYLMSTFLLQESGLSKWLGDELSVFSSLEPWRMNLVLCVVVAAATEVTSNTAICTLMMPIMAQIVRKQEYYKVINFGFVLWNSVFLVPE